MPHTILLVQVGHDDANRIWADCDSVQEACDAVLKMYEEYLKKTYPQVANIQYSVDDLFGYLDEFGDVSCLVLDPSDNKYVPHDKEWVKGRIFNTLKKSAV